MKFRKLGRQGPEVSALGLGCMSMGIAGTYTSSVRDDEDAVRLIHRALELGLTLLEPGARGSLESPGKGAKLYSRAAGTRVDLEPAR